MEPKYYNQAQIEYGMMWALKNGIGEFVWHTMPDGQETIFEQTDGVHLTIGEFQTLLGNEGYLNG